MATHPEPEWKKLKLSFERPYKDDSGNPIPVLYDLTPEGERIYEPKEIPATKLGENLRRIFQERGTDFFEKNRKLLKDGLAESEDKKFDPEAGDAVESEQSVETKDLPKVMTVEELFAMRSEILPQLFVAQGEMSHAKDLLEAILSETTPTSSSLLAATQVTKPPPIVSVQTFDAQLTVGHKDEALRKASSLFKSAAQSMERSRLQGERYWVAALQVRRANWGLTPAPLPFGAPTGKSADKTSKDFVISYGLEGSPPNIRRHAVAQLSSGPESTSNIMFPSHQHTRLQVSIAIPNCPPQVFVAASDLRPFSQEDKPLDNVLKGVQTEVVDQEIFSTLVSDAGNLSTAHGTVSERLISIEVARDVGLTFELVDSTAVKHRDSREGEGSPICESIYHALRILLLRRHAQANAESTRNRERKIRTRPSILQPVIDLLQYREFCKNVDLQLRRATKALNNIGIPSTLEFTAVGEAGQVLVSLLGEAGKKNVGGEAVVRIDTWSTLAFTFLSPCTLIAQLSHATIPISTVPALTQILVDEIERCVLQRICELGRDIVGGIWFIDFDHCVARWEGCVLNFRISYDGESKINCSAFRLSTKSPNRGTNRTFVGGTTPLLSWVTDVINESKDQPHL